MIRWKEHGIDWPHPRRERWRRSVCRLEIRRDGTCMGVARWDDDEPHDICKACDRLEGDAE